MAACNFSGKDLFCVGYNAYIPNKEVPVMSNTFEKNHLPVEDEQPTLSENKFPEVDEEEEDYDEPQPWMDEFEYIDWLISHR